MLNNDGKRKLLAYNIAKYRKLKGLSQNQLAEMVNKSRKLLEKQKRGKKRMKAVGKVEVPQEAFMAVLSLNG